MGDLTPIAFDIETSGFDDDAVLTVAGFAHELGELLILNTEGRSADHEQLERALREYSVGNVDLTVTSDEAGLVSALKATAQTHLDGDRHYLTAYYGEIWNGGFDLPFLRSVCVKHEVDWPFPNLAYADVLDIVDRFDTNEESDLIGVYNELVGNESCDPFDESEAAVGAFDSGEWEPLLLHNLADIQRTRELAILGGAYVPQSDFQMKNLQPPNP